MPTQKKTSDKVTDKSAPTKPAKKPSIKEEAKQEVKKVVAHKPKVPKPRAVAGGFMEFLREQSVVGLAIGLVIGAQVKALADQLIASFINPLLGLVMPGSGALDKKTFTLSLGHKSALFGWGKFTAALLSFTVTAAVIYAVFKMLKLDTLTKKKS